MTSLQSHSTHWRETCSYPTHGVDFRDYVRGNFKDFNIVTYNGAGQCKKVEFVNIRGHVGMHCTARFWQKTGAWGLHIDSSHTGCHFKPTSGSVSGEDNFGFYEVTNPKFRCSKDDQSTNSGGLEVICEDHDLNHRINIPVDSPKTLIVVVIFVYRKEELVNDPTQK